MASTQSISAALESVNAKKENLRKTFQDLQSHSSFLSSFTLQWKDLEDHFESIQKSIEERFNELKSKEKESINGSISLENQSLPVKVPEKKIDLSGPVPRPEIKSFCSKMDGMGFRSFIMRHRKDLSVIRDEVGVGLKFASDPAKLVLDALLGFFPPNSKGDKDGELAATRRTCILLLERLFELSPEIKPQVKDKANKLAIEWKGKITSGDENPLEPLGFLQLLATYGLASSFDANELLDLAVSIARRKQAIDLCRSLGFNEKMPDLIRKLVEKGKHLDAVKFAYAFELVDMFPPVPLLKAYKKQSKKIANEVRQKGKQSLQSQNEATAKQIAALRAIVKCIEEHKLESEYPRDGLDQHIEQLERQLSSKKRGTGPVSGANQQQPLKQQQQHSGNKRGGPATGANQQHSVNKRPRPASTYAVSSSANTGVVLPSQAEYYRPPTNQADYYHQSSLLVQGQDRVSPYLGGGSLAHHVGLLGSNPNSTTVPQFSSSSAVAGPYGTGPSSLNYGLNLSPSRSQLYSFEHHLSSALYDRQQQATGLAGHVLPPSSHQSAVSFGGHVLPPANHPYYP
ncbi:Frigida-like [Macleaya cordata]|uniref:FRIGIDA-like protein n=1 Tax=Macleaya cordata TaxID=56857 RepID=A0A200QX95_MACCD|nr:Frigida-like [Macleaya cordata]